MNQVSCENFNEVYPKVNSWILSKGVTSPSRNGDVKKLREFVTRISNPSQNLVGGFQREINPFFLFVEAMWIWAGRSDVATLLPFNSRMGNFSDDGKIFHAAYGYRLRNHFNCDQIQKAIEMLDIDSSSRRVVMQIWDTDNDLGVDTKDIPCNDMIALSVDEDNKLRMSIFNRSNDIHWGLPTNIYQFSFIGTMISNCLGIEYGTQTHFSNDLHCYLSNPIAERMEKNYNDFQGMFSDFESIYDYSHAIDLNFDFEKTSFEKFESESKMWVIDSKINDFLDAIESQTDSSLFVNNTEQPEYVSKGMTFMVASCLLYQEIKYKKGLPGANKEDINQKVIIDLMSLAKNYGQEHTDFALLAVNFFASKLEDKTVLPSLLEAFGCYPDVKEYIGWL